MARKVFFSFHYQQDAWRASQVRNIGVVEGNASATDNKWEEVKRGGDAAIRHWIDEQLTGRSCTVVLVGAETADRQWVRYEIEKSWNDGNKGVLGIRIHRLLDHSQQSTIAGSNPFERFTLKNGGELSAQLHPLVRLSVAELVRSMNCYYSNLIEGHNTHPRDIDRALAADYSSDPDRRDLQLEARAHIEVQQMIDERVSELPRPPASRAFIEWTHREFCARLPESLLVVDNPDTRERIPVVPGQLRAHTVAVGRHVAPAAEDLPAFMRRFEEAYDSARLTKPRQVVAVAAAHHRFLWIHPFLDGNGRVARLMSHAMLLEIGIGSALWSVSRGLARNSSDYKRLLMAADEPRRNDLDGRGALSHAALIDFCRFFLETCLDQVRYMRELLDPAELQRRMELYVRDEESAERLPKRSYAVLREALLSGEMERGRIPQLIDTSERTARRVVSELIDKRLLVSASHKAPLRLGFPIDVVERWFPKLYPVT